MLADKFREPHGPKTTTTWTIEHHRIEVLEIEVSFKTNEYNLLNCFDFQELHIGNPFRSSTMFVSDDLDILHLKIIKLKCIPILILSNNIGWLNTNSSNTTKSAFQVPGSQVGSKLHAENCSDIPFFLCELHWVWLSVIKNTKITTNDRLCSNEETTNRRHGLGDLLLLRWGDLDRALPF